MDRQSDANSNGRFERDSEYEAESNGRGAYPLVEVRRVWQPPIYKRRSPSLLPLVVLLLTMGLGAAMFIAATRQPAADAIPKAEAFRWAVNRAMSAAELTQTARSEAEWQQVTNWWQEAIKLMKAVPLSDANYRLSLAKIDEYQTNLQYAQHRLTQSASTQPAPVASSEPGKTLWGIGSRRALVIKTQGQPTRVDRYDSMCKEVLHYGKSTVELHNGRVLEFADFDRKLKATDAIAPPPPESSSWDLGSTKDSVFKIQGTPTRIVSYDYSDRETLYYGSSTIEMMKQRVTGYHDVTGNLRVRTAPIVTQSGGGNFWTLESSREDILRVQGTPTKIALDDAACTETFSYGQSTVNLKNGFISGYDNLGNNLRVRAK